MPDSGGGGWNGAVTSAGGAVSVCSRDGNLESSFACEDGDFKARGVKECVKESRKERCRWCLKTLLVDGLLREVAVYSLFVDYKYGRANTGFIE